MTGRDPRLVTYVYRQNSPPGCKGRECRLLALSLRQRDSMNVPIVNTGASLVAVEFLDTGEKLMAQRQALAPEGTRQANQARSVAADPRTKSERAYDKKKQRMEGRR